MATVRVKVIHDCETPNMIERTESYPVRTFWNVLFNTGRKPEVTTKYKAKQARWTCHCGAEWAWSSLIYGSWTCLSRPNKWERLDV